MKKAVADKCFVLKLQRTAGTWNVKGWIYLQTFLTQESNIQTQRLINVQKCVYSTNFSGCDTEVMWQ